MQAPGHTVSITTVLLAVFVELSVLHSCHWLMKKASGNYFPLFGDAKYPCSNKHIVVLQHYMSACLPEMKRGITSRALLGTSPFQSEGSIGPLW